MNGPQRIILIDADGTIAEHGSIIAPSTVSSIRTARAAGHLVYLCTGRSAGDVAPAVRDIGYDGEITNSGALVTIDGEVKVQHLMSRADVDLLQDHFAAIGALYFLQTAEAVFGSPGVEKFIKAPINYRPLVEANLDRVAKAVFVCTDDDGIAAAQQALGERFHVIPGSIRFPDGSDGEISLTGITKGSAIVEVLNILGIDRKDSVGIGDSWNDAEMFDVVGTAVAMADTPPELAARADFMTTGVLDDGVHNALARLGLL